VTRRDFQAVLDRAKAGWESGDSEAVADCFAEDVEYGDPFRYRFLRRSDLLPFFEAPPGGQRVTWHAVYWDEAQATGVVEYTYEGHHRYHGAAIARVGPDGRIAQWREYQHLDDATDWETRMRGPEPDDAVLASIDHVQLGMPADATAEADVRAFYGGVLGLREVPKPAQLAGRGGAWFVGRAATVHLGVEPDFRPPARAHPAFVVDDLTAALERLAAAGVAIENDDSGLPVRRCYVRDPFGNRIELVDAADAGFTGP
jgi:catechol 2,3-dioxygenase-like lactoylglutathione lyase family enzyme